MPLGAPTVLKGKARIRVMISATHSHDDSEKSLEEAFIRVGKQLKVVA